MKTTKRQPCPRSGVTAARTAGAPGSQPNATGPFLAAYKRYERVGAANVSDAELMAGFCAYSLQTLVGAVSPQLVWESAQHLGMTAIGLADLCTRKPRAAADLMWI